MKYCFVQVDKDSPEFVSKHNSVEQLVLMDMSHISVLLHKEALVVLLEYASSINTRLEAAKESSHVTVHKSSSSIQLKKVNNCELVICFKLSSYFNVTHSPCFVLSQCSRDDGMIM